MISCIVPAWNEQNYICRTIDSLLRSAAVCDEPIEIIVVDNGSTDKTREMVLQYPTVSYLHDPVRSRVHAKNYGASKTTGEILAFVDADLIVSKEFFTEISEKGANPYFVGGGMKWIKLTRYSPGIVVGCILSGLYYLIKQITVGVFWIRKEAFDAIGGFREFHYDDVDFALRLKEYAKIYDKKFVSLKKSRLLWSTRRCDKEGDWKWLNRKWFCPEIVTECQQKFGRYTK